MGRTDLYPAVPTPASSGGAYMTAIEGFAGIRQENGVLKADPNLPEGWNSLTFKIIYHGSLYQVKVTKEKAEITCLGKYAEAGEASVLTWRQMQL